MKVYIATKLDSKTPVRGWDDVPIIYNSKAAAKQNLCISGKEQVREARLDIGNVVK
jgi:hypothetical protein